MSDPTPVYKIGLLQESSLHNQLKQWYRKDKDQLEVKVGRYVIDLVRGDLLVEFQTRNFSSIKNKLNKLLEKHEIRLVHPVFATKTIVKKNSKGEIVSSRKSPKKQSFIDVVDELVSAPLLLENANLSLEIVLLHVKEIWIDDGKGSWRRKGQSIEDRRITEIIESRVINSYGEFLDLLDQLPPREFTTQDLAQNKQLNKARAQKLAYCLHKAGVSRKIGAYNRHTLYEWDKPEVD